MQWLWLFLVTLNTILIPTQLPFLGPTYAAHWQTRMTINADNTFACYGRPSFRHIYEAVMAMTENKTKYFIDGSLGAWCRLVSKVVAYLPDCRSLVKLPMSGLRFALTLRSMAIQTNGLLFWS